MNPGTRWLSSFSVLLALAAPAAAQAGKGKFELQAAIEPATCKAGDTVTLVLQATVADGWHAYGTREKTNVPVALKADKWQLGGLELAGAAEIPPGERHDTLGIEQFPLGNEFTVKQALKVPAGMAAGEITVKGALAYQICDANSCLPPSTMAFSAKVKVQGAAGAAPVATQEPKPLGTKPGLKLDPDGEKFTVTARFDPATARAGDTVKLVLEAVVDPQFHAYGSRETGNIPVALDGSKLKRGGLELVGKPVIPPGERHEQLGITSFPLPHEFAVTQTLRVPVGAKAGDVVLEGELDYQICDENMCLPPASAPFSATLVVQAPGNGQSGSKPGVEVAQDPDFAIVARFDPTTARAGETVRLVLHVKVVETHHAYGSNETGQVPVTLDPTKLKAGGLEPVGEAEVPPGERTEKAGMASWPLPHEFEVVQTFVVPAGTRPGDITVDGAIDYQICDESSCKEATDAPFRAVLHVEAGEPRADRAAKPVDPPKTGANEPKLREPKYTLDDVGNENGLTGSLWSLILLSIAGGLFALVMPCTYPMIPITFSFFTKQADRRSGNVLSLALTYGIGIVLMFVVIGVAVGGPIISFAGHWATNLVIGVAFVIFAMSLFGFFTLQLPAFVTNTAGRASATGGLVGVFLMGATLVISSFTCTAPIVGALLAGVADTGAPASASYFERYGRVAFGMAVFGLTMAAPFVFLAMLPGRVKALPKSGEWMNTLKISLGFVELAAALKFFSNVELARGWHILPRETFLMIWAFLFVALALFLFGMLGYRGVAVEGVSKTRNGFGLLSLAFAFYCLFGVTGFQLDPVMTAFEPPYRLRPVDEHTIVKDDHDVAVSLAARDGKYVLVNFTGFT